MKFTEALGKAIAWRREDLKLSQKQLSAEVETSRPYLCALEAGKLNAGVSNIHKLAIALQTKVSTLCQQAEKFLKEEK